MKKTIILVLMSMFILFIINPNVQAVCVQTGVTGNFSVGERVTVTITCQDSDKEKDLNYTWKNQTGFILEQDLNIVPAESPFVILEDFLVPASAAPQINLSGRLLLDNNFVSQSSFNTSLTGGSSDIDIVNCQISTNIFEGSNFGIECFLESQGDSISLAEVCYHIDDTNDVPIENPDLELCSRSGTDGKTVAVFACDPSWCNSGEFFEVVIDAACPSNSVSKGSMEVCIQTKLVRDVALGRTSVSFQVDRLSDSFIIPKWIDAAETEQPAVYMKNENGAKVEMKSNPARINQSDIDWLGFNNTLFRGTLDNGEAFLTAGQRASVCMLINNTFLNEIPIVITNINFDDDELEQFFNPIDAQTGEVIRAMVLASVSVKPVTDEGLQEKCTESFLIPDTFRGGNDWDVNFNIIIDKITSEILEVESDEFNIYSRSKEDTFVSIIDVKNISITAFNTDVFACSRTNVTFTYDYFGDDESKFPVKYCFEQTTDDIQIGCIEKEINPDFGENKVITETFTIPFTENGGEAEVDISIFRDSEQQITGFNNLIGFGDFEPHNTFNISVNNSDDCRYRQTDDQFLQARQSRALESSLTEFGNQVTELQNIVQKLGQWLSRWIIR